MNTFLIKLLIFFTINGCTDNHKANHEGYLFVDIASIYYNDNKLTILDKGETPLVSFENKTITIDNNKYDIIEDEYLYRDLFKVESYYPEYNLFILKAERLDNGYYIVSLNKTKGFIDANMYKDILTFKTPKEYILDSYPNPTEDNPLRDNPSDTSNIISNYEDYTYISVEIVGDWLKVKDDKECYLGENPSDKDIIGWIRWKKNDEIIIDIRHIC